MQSCEDATTTTRRGASGVTRTVASRGTRVSDGANETTGQAEPEMTILQKLLEAISEQRKETRKITSEQRNVIGKLRDMVSRQGIMIQEQHRQLQEQHRQLQE